MLGRGVWSFIVLILVTTASPSFGQYQTNGSAISTSCNCWRVTPDANNESGSVWNVNLFDLSDAFNYNFDVFLGCDNGGADGLAFVLQSLSVNAGSSGGGMGYAGIVPSLAIEMDNYRNTGEPSFDHMAIQQDGVPVHNSPNNLAGPVPISATSDDIEDCDWHTFRVDWNPSTQTMNVFFDDELRLTYTGDIINDIFGGNPNVYWGFTSATGGSFNEHQFCNALDPDFEFVSQSQCVGIPIAFESSSTVATGVVSDYEWDFGDGNTASGAQVSHAYTAAGNYDVTLTITSEGCSESIVTQVTINPLPNVDLGPDLSICEGGSVQIAANGLLGGEQIQWSPTQGLDNPTLTNPIVTPTDSITYTLEVVDSNGCVNEDDIKILVNVLPFSQFDPNIKNCLNDTTTFEDQSSVPNILNDVITNWTWDFGDGNTSSLSDPEHLYQTDGFFTVSLITETDKGCSDTVQHEVEVYPLPVIDFTSNYTEGCQPLTVQFEENVTIPAPYSISQFIWNLGNGSDSINTQNPVTLYNDQDIDELSFSQYTVSLQATSGNGCVSTDTVENYITEYPKPEALFTAEPSITDVLDPEIKFEDLSSPNVTDWFWDFEGTNASIEQHPTNLFPALVDTYLVTLYVTTAFGCADTVSAQVEVQPVFTFYIPDAFTPNSDRINEAFFGDGVGFKSYTMSIYNRWGEEIFYSDDQKIKWGGTFKGMPAEQGVYAYYFHVVDWKDNEHEYRGHVTLRR